MNQLIAELDGLAEDLARDGAAGVETVASASQQLARLERENTALRNEIARLNNQTNWVCKCGGTDCEGQKENAALREDIHAHEQINKQLIEDKRRLDWLTDTGCWLTFPSLSKHPNWKYGTARDVIDLARKEAQP